MFHNDSNLIKSSVDLRFPGPWNGKVAMTPISFCTLRQARHETFGRLNAELGLVPMGTSGSAGVFVNTNLFSTGKKKKHVEHRDAHLNKSRRAAVARIFHNPPQPKKKPHSEARTSQGLSPRGTRDQKGEVEDFSQKKL